MKKLFLVLFLAGVCQMATAQKFGYIDTDFILGKMPEAKKAQSDLEASSASGNRKSRPGPRN
jgi:outer membrane protein